MFEIEGEIHSDPRKNVWVDRLPAADFASSIVGGYGPKMVVLGDGADFALTIDGAEHARFGSIGEALAEGHGVRRTVQAALEESAYAASGLDRARWRLLGRVFRDGTDADRTIEPGRDGVWKAMLGNHELGTAATGAGAEAVFATTPHVPTDQLRRLEGLWSGALAEHHPSRFEDLAAAGLAEVFDGRTRLTDTGRERIDSDPRTIPVAVREAIVEEGVRTIVADGSHSAHSTDPGNEAADLRREWAEFVNATGIYKENSIGLMDALSNGLDLWRDRIDSDPNEVALMGEGNLADGVRVSKHAVMLLAPAWSDDAPTSELLVDAIVSIRDELVAIVAPTKAPAP